MSPKLYALTIALALAAGFTGHALSGRFLTPAVAEARARDSSEQWEYCAVTKAQYPGSIRGGVYWIAYFKTNGVQVVDVSAGPTENAMAKAVARLGEDGWAMVCGGPLEVRPGTPGGTQDAIYFRRRKD
jgi:hypothetical protein